jgi:cyclic-di-AMP phosphodiesterase PgpH
MLTRFTKLIEAQFAISENQTVRALRRTAITATVLLFAIFCTVVVGFDDIFIEFNNVANLTIGSVPTDDVIAREGGTFVSESLTRQEQENARAQVPAVFDPPEPDVARQQTQLTQRILEFIDNVRADQYATLEQQTSDIQQVTALTLDDETIQQILQLTDDNWSTVRNETITVLERVMRQSIRESELQNFRDQLPTQVSVRLSEQASQIVTAITNDVIRPNTFENPEKTLASQEEAANAIEPQERQFIVGQIVAPANEIVDELSYEALQELGLLAQVDNRGLFILRAFVASTLTIVLIGLYINRFEPQLFTSETGTTVLIAVIFLIALITVRAFGLTGNIYLFPAATLGILSISIISPNLAIVGAIGFAFLTGLMGRNSLEIATLFAAGNITAILTLRDAGRLNNYFISGAIVGLTNTAVVATFTVLIGTNTSNISNLASAFFGGAVIVPTISFAGMYALTIMFNLPTAFKLMDLSQPSKPLLQRLLREAPGTYQHSLQVANLAEQAAQAIGADAQLTHVSALYHDIGKMANPVFFTENQQHVDNPHESLNDPYRSADIIISHATEGDVIAKKYNLPNRIRDFIREHHGTTQVYVFYKRAIERAGSEDAVDITDFTYPGPIPQSRETAVMMMADSCESAVRAIKPQSNKEIAEIVHRIIESKRNDGQLNDSNLTLNDLQKIEEIFIDIFKGLFHPRIDYEKAIKPKAQNTKRDTTPKRDTAPKRDTSTKSRVKSTDETKPKNPIVSSTEPKKTREVPIPRSDPNVKKADDSVPSLPRAKVDTPKITPKVVTDTGSIPAINNNDEPLNEVPPLPKRNGIKSTQEIRKVDKTENSDGAK